MLNDTIMRRIAKEVKENHKRRKWRQRNRHNQTILRDCAVPEAICVGNNSYGEINVITFGTDHRIKIGNFVSIAPKVFYILDAEHYTNHLSTYPFRVGILREKVEAFGKGDIIVDDDVWIGYGATILSGVHIHQGAVVAAGAVVGRDVPPYAIVGGAPSKVIRYRFDQAVIDFLLTLDYGKLDSGLVQAYVDELYKPIDGMELDDIKELYGWFPKRSILVGAECRSKKNA